MIVSKTVMERMPERCERCILSYSEACFVSCFVTGTVSSKNDPRPPDCPLVEVDSVIGHALIVPFPMDKEE